MRFFQFILREIRAVLIELILIWPNSGLGARLRSIYYTKTLKTIGPRLRIQRGARIGRPGLVEIGSDFGIGDYASIEGGESLPIFIGNHVGIARHSYIRSANHRIDDLNRPILFQGHESKELAFRGKTYSVVIEDDVWIGANSVVLPGSHIGTGAVVGANSVVSGVVPAYSVVMGNPARVVKSRKPATPLERPASPTL